MSTRAIIAVRNGNGSITGAWCWNDGYDIIDNLVDDFNTPEAVSFIMNLGMFNTIFTKEAAEDYKAWCRNQGIECNNKEFYEYGNSVILQDKVYQDRTTENYKDMREALGQDINILYLYNNGTWELYEDAPESEHEDYIEKVAEIAEGLGWTVTVEDNIITFQRYSGCGQDFSFELDVSETSDEFTDNLYSYYSDFDVSRETYLWLDESGHGTNGAPYDMIDVYNDMKECEEAIHDLWSEIHNTDFE